MTICPICQEDLPDPHGVLAGVLALDEETRNGVLSDLLTHAEARQVLRDPLADQYERAQAYRVLGVTG